MNYSKDLLEQAEHLLAREKKRPKQASLRRALSAAYYSLFHFLLQEAAAMVAGSGHGKREVQSLISRALTHSQMKSACNELLKPTPTILVRPYTVALSLGRIPELVNVAETFNDLQEKRHQADYDLRRNFSRAQVRTAKDRVVTAKEDWMTLKKQHPDAAQFFALSLFFMDSWRKR